MPMYNETYPTKWRGAKEPKRKQGEETMATYKIAFARENGDWDVVDTFEASDDDVANKYAEENNPEEEWYVLDSCGQNING